MKKILYSVLTLSVMFAAVSCEDMLDPESDLVMYEKDNRLNSVNDTLYSVMGVVNLMQKVADRTNLLGEVRGDLVTVTADASTDLQALADFTADTDNSYNKPQDYYAIVNNCNYFIQTADTSYTKQGQKVFEREMAVMHTFRAWAYLQLAINYGEVPFYTEFLGTEKAAEEVSKQPYKSIDEICSWLIEDLTPWATVLPLDYGSISSNASKSFFIPTRVMLGELCLWSGRYREAAQWYHDWLTDTDNPHPITRSNAAAWSTIANPSTMMSLGHSNAFSSRSEWVAFIPMESNAFDGTISYLQDLYNSTEDNDYYFELTYSNALVNLSAEQAYYYVYEENNVRDTVCMTADSIVDTYITDRKQVGDLRLYNIVQERANNQSSSSKYNTSYQNIRKFQSDHVILYRLPIVYLHYAEALNRAGYPSAAFAVLKYGLSTETLNRAAEYPIADAELESIGNLITFSQYTFTSANTWGIHSRGCGDAEANPEYVIPTSCASSSDSIAWVEDRIVDELALEGCFEGQRYYDLLRVATRRGDASYLADRVAARNGATDIDNTLRARLLQTSNWYLPLRK